MDEVKQCKSCPWRTSCDPEADIPRYSLKLAKGLKNTIASGLESLLGESARRVMACHYSEPGKEFACAGWLHNQAGTGNNIGVRLAIMTGNLPAPVIDGPQHLTFEDTLPKKKKKKGRSK